MLACHIDHCQRLDMQLFTVNLHQNLITGMKLCSGENFMLGEQFQIFRGNEGGQRVCRSFEVQQPAPFGLLDPFLGIVVAVENNPLMFRDCLLYTSRCV